MGFEPTTFCVTGRRAFQTAPRRRIVFSSSSGIRTHSISGSKPKWSASCLPSRVKLFFEARPQGFEPRSTGLEPVMLPLHQRRLFGNQIAPFPQAAVAGIEPASGRLTVVFPYQHGTHRNVVESAWSDLNRRSPGPEPGGFPNFPTR